MLSTRQGIPADPVAVRVELADGIEADQVGGRAGHAADPRAARRKSTERRKRGIMERVIETARGIAEYAIGRVWRRWLRRDRLRVIAEFELRDKRKGTTAPVLRVYIANLGERAAVIGDVRFARGHWGEQVATQYVIPGGGSLPRRLVPGEELKL
jgi:hypothetical protein